MTRPTLLLCILVICTQVFLISFFNKFTNVQNGTAVIAAKSAKQLGGDKLSILLPPDLTPRQSQILKTAYDIAKSDGNPSPEKFQAILLTETDACTYGKYKVAGQEFGGKERYYGCGQVKLQTAKAVMQKHPELWKYMQTREDEEIIANLILNDEFNLQVASKYFLMAGSGKADDFAATAYNQGPGGAKKVNPATFGYTVKVNKNLARVKQHQTKR
jgi:hypothetical protein